MAVESRWGSNDDSGSAIFLWPSFADPYLVFSNRIVIASVSRVFELLLSASQSLTWESRIRGSTGSIHRFSISTFIDELQSVNWMVTLCGRLYYYFFRGDSVDPSIDSATAFLVGAKRLINRDYVESCFVCQWQWYLTGWIHIFLL